jgi:AraC family transcriptional regulator
MPPADNREQPAVVAGEEPTGAAQADSGAGEPWRGLAPHRLNRVLACIEARLAERIQVCELAREIPMSLFHFARMFKRATGHSPHRYVTLRRMERAKELLAATSMPIAEVARTVGFKTQAHFTGVFSQHVGTTPKAYRLGHRP